MNDRKTIISKRAATRDGPLLFWLVQTLVQKNTNLY